MPYTRKTHLWYPKKGSAQAKQWGRTMAALKKRKRRSRRR